MATFRKGDLVSINLIVDGKPFGSDVRLRMPDGGYQDFYAKVADITMVRPSLDIGDTVEWTVDVITYRGEVLAIAGDHLWVDEGGGEYATVWRPQAKRIDADAPAETDEAA